MRGPTSLVVAAFGLLLAGCAPNEQRADDARLAVALALERGDRFSALEAIRERNAILPRTPESLLEVERRRILAEDAPGAAWASEAGVRRFPERDDLRLALANVALQIGNPSLALQAVALIQSDSEEHAAALIVRSQAELHLGDLEPALATLDEVERLHPDQPAAWLARISTLLAEHRLCVSEADRSPACRLGRKITDRMCAVRFLARDKRGAEIRQEELFQFKGLGWPSSGLFPAVSTI